MDIIKARTAIDQAIQNGSALYISYRNNQGNTSSRVISPIQWANDYVFLAYCHAAQEKRHFKISNILELEFFDTLEEALEYQKNLTIESFHQLDSYPIPSRNLQSRKDSISSPKSPPIFSRVTKDDEWSRLLKYYSECLTREHRQQYVLKPEQLRPSSYTVQETHQFILGKLKLIIQPGKRSDPNPIFEFIQKKYGEFNVKLCLGYPFLVIDKDRVAPLIYAPVEISFGTISNDKEFTLQSEGYEISYAALKSLEMTDEEIETFLEECDQVNIEDQEVALFSLEDLIFNKIAEIYQTPLPRVKERIIPGTIYQSPAFFWVENNIATMNLIRELKDLSNPSHWSTTSLALRQLLNIVPEHDYPSLPEEQVDNGIYVTPINRQQLRAMQSVRKEPIVVVTGPPGTGKSQLVLNLISEAFLKGEKVLFASRNNRAVDVVMSRLQNEIGFQGAVRTGNQINRKAAASQMRTALSKAPNKASSNNHVSEELIRAYFTVRDQFLDSQKKLEQILRLKGLLASYQQERELYLGFLPQELSVIENFVPEYREEETQKLLTAFSNFLEQILKLKEEKSRLETWLNDISRDRHFSLIKDFHRIEDQFGDFGNGFLHSKKFATVDDLIHQIHNWLNSIELIEKESQATIYYAELKRLDKLLAEKLALLPLEWLEYEKFLVKQYSSEEIENLLKETEVLKEWFRNFSSKSLPLSERLLNLLTFGYLFRKKLKLLFYLYEQCHLPIQIHQKPSPENSLQRAQNLIDLLNSAILYKQQREMVETCQVLLGEIRDLRSKIPEAIQYDITKLPSFDFENNDLRIELGKLLKEAENLEEQVQRCVSEINLQIEENGNGFLMLRDLKKQTYDRFPDLWQQQIPANLDQVIAHLTKWHNIVFFWKANYGCQQTSQSLAKLPTEDQARSALNELQGKMLTTSGEILRTKWFERASKLDNEVYQKTSDYITAVEKTADFGDREDYKAYKATERENFIAASQMFPIWATTNLAARTNFPLESGLFDLVIIDEASQCDFASALPLLFRGKKIVIIGDPNQLRHVATLSKESDRELTQKFGVGFDAFSYNSCSLFDIALRSCGSQPGVLLLDEHYRSDARIINFSNQEFYDNKLKIRTDLTKRNVRKTFLNQFGGMFWLHTRGQVSYPPNGSCCNETEAEYIMSLLPQLFEALERLEMGNSSIGIVTPFRAQEERIRNLIQSHYGITDKITVGTAHKFQGDEKDFMIFSTVIGEGTKEGTLSWLDQTRNLLNVAVTRARVTLIVVGDVNFCLELNEGHC
ncbi:MAG: AAA domain-containing protein, partial [Anaerolineales bacterium]|nr:AAA domain-containing protein [Anaerolineales bacterium]